MSPWPIFQTAHASDNLVPQPYSTQQQITPANYPGGVTVASVDEVKVTAAGGAGQFRHSAGVTSDQACVSFTQAPCDLTSRSYTDNSITYGYSGAAACANNSENYCVESITIKKNGKTVNLKPVSEIPVTSGSFTGDPSNGVPGSGSTATIWVDDSTSELYSSSATLAFSFDASGKMVTYSTTTPFSLTIKRVAIKDQAKTSESNFAAAPCLFVLKESCFVDLVQDTISAISASVRLPLKLSGWFYGRMAGTTVKGSKTTSYVRYQFTGVPAAIPVFAKDIPKSKCVAGWCPDRLIVDALLGVNWEKSFGTGYSADKAKNAWQYLQPPTGVTPWQTFVQIADDTATAIRTAWSITFSNSLASISNTANCPNATDGVNGVLSSNAMIYSSFGPTLQNGSYFYRVAGLHFMPDGKTPALGTYELQIDSQLARCVFKLTKAPISATLSVIESDGTQSAVVGSSSERDGMFRIAMQGFHFSTPQLKVKISQGKPSSTIACVSLRSPAMTKFVTSTSPKCPSGYAKKSN